MSNLLYIIAAISSLVLLGVSGAPAVNNKLDNNQLTDNDSLGLNRYDLPDFSSAATDFDIDKTVSQVQRILELNPQLPRLSNNEILFLLKNITSEDNLKAHTDAESIVGSNIPNDQFKTKNKNEKLTMVVLPYNTEDASNGDVTELYTKAPIVTFESSTKTKPIVVFDEDDDDDENDEDEGVSVYKNHKYSAEDNKSPKKPNGFNGKTSSNDYWKNQAQKVMEDLEKQNQPKKISLDIPFKQMPDVQAPLDFEEVPNDFETSDIDSINKLLNGNNNGYGIPKTNGALKPLALYDFKPLPDLPTDFELILPKGGDDESLVAHSSSAFIGNNDIPNSENLYVPPKEIKNNVGKTTEYSVYPKPDVTAYMSFKPLPTDNNSNGEGKSLDLDRILDEYGITESLNNMYLPSQPTETSNGNGPDILTNTDFVEEDMFPASMTSILTDMGLTKKKNGRKMNDNEKNGDNNASDDSYSYNAPPKIDTKYGLDPMNDKEMNGVYESLNMIKREMDEEAVVEEVKKEDISNKTDEDSSDKDNSESKDSGPSLAALEDSFGASPADKDPSEAVLPPPRRNGFYYMVDWNSFLEVGEEGNARRVNIRFEPKLGDPQMFVFGNKNNN